MDSHQIRVVTVDEAKELNEAVLKLRDFCAKGLCAECPFSGLGYSNTVCGLRATTPQNWDTIKLTELEAI